MSQKYANTYMVSFPKTEAKGKKKVAIYFDNYNATTVELVLLFPHLNVYTF